MMKKKLVLLAAGLGLVVCMNAQNWSGSTPGNIFYNQGSVIVGSTETKGGDKFHVNTGGQYFRVMQDGFGVADAGWRNTLILSNYYDYNEIYNNDGTPLVLQYKYGGNVGIGTSNPQSLFHIKSDVTSPYIRLEKQSNVYESGLVFTTLNTPDFYIFTDNTDNNLKIEASGLNGEADNTPRMQFPRSDKNIHMVLSGGNVLIGKTTQDNPAYKLDVAGSIRANEIKVNTTGADFVFEPTYKLRPLAEVETFINQHKHLPDVASAADMQSNGVSMGEMQAKLLQKVEELTLYSIEQDKKLADQAKQNAELKQELEALKQFITQKLK